MAEQIPETGTMAMQASEIESLIQAAFPDATITIEDLRGDGDHYACNVVSSAFVGKTRVQQHQMVYQALGGRMGGELHALALQTSTPKGE
jgi:stress-induced morphogen